jgi:hypothetical protein
MEIMETIEKKLSDYRGFTIYKITDNKGLSNKETTYEASTENDALFDCSKSLKDLKKSIDRYLK